MSSTPEGKTADPSADAGYDYDAAGRLLVATDAAGGSWTDHGAILTGNPPDAGDPIGPFMGVFVGSGGNQHVGGASRTMAPAAGPLPLTRTRLPSATPTGA